MLEPALRRAEYFNTDDTGACHDEKTTIAPTWEVYYFHIFKARRARAE